jgi:hypothetical protein
MAKQNDGVFLKTLAKIADHGIHVFNSLLEGCCVVFGVQMRVFVVGPAAAPLVPGDQGVGIAKRINIFVGQEGIRAGRAAMETEDHRVIYIPAPQMQILFLPVDGDKDLFLNASGRGDIVGVFLSHFCLLL